jgi:Protein of unknown function (DUF2510)
VTLPSFPATGGPAPAVSRSGRPAVATLALLTAATTLLGWLLPLTTGSGPSRNLASADWSAVVLMLIISGVLTIAAVGVSTRPGTAGLAGGVGLAGGALSLFMGVLLAVVVDSFSSFGGGGVGVGPGTILLIASGVLGIFTFLSSFSAPSRRNEQAAPASGIRVLGACSAALVSLGLMMPPPARHVAVADWLLLGHGVNGFISASYLLLLVSPGIAGVVGFLSRRRSGLPLALGGFIPFGWIFVVSLLDRVRSQRGLNDSGLANVFRHDFHPLFGIGMAGVALFLVLGVLAGRTAPAGTGVAASVTVGHTNPARWTADPFGRHESRYWDGQRWTQHVADAGVAGIDQPFASTPPVPQPLPPPSVH